MPVLVGVKFDLLVEAPAEQQRHVEATARRFAEALDCPLVFCSAAVPINVFNVFKVLLLKLFRLRNCVAEEARPGQPMLLYESAGGNDELLAPPPEVHAHSPPPPPAQSPPVQSSRASA
jgi:GTP-binding protein of the ras superfamily involved in termination of M-phase